MSYTLPPITLTENVTSYVTLPGGLGAVSWVKIVNASPYLCQLSNILGGTDYMQPGEANIWQVPGLSTAIQITPQQFGINPVIIPSSVAVVTWYLEGEQPQGNYPVNFSALSYVGNNVQVNSATNTIEQDLLTPFVYSGLAPSSTPPTQYSATAGIAYLRQSDSSLLRIAYALVVQTLSTPSSTFYHDINPDGTYSIATTHSLQPNYLTIATITTNASGNISSVTDTRVMSTVMLSGMSSNPGAPGVELYNLHVTKDIQCDDVISVQGISKVTGPSSGNGYIFSIGGQDELIMMPTGSTVLQGVVIYGVVANNPAISLPLFSVGSTFNVGGTWVDIFGQLHSVAPLTLAAGNQETGRCGIRGSVLNAGEFMGVMVNFKTVMTNTPTSITLVATVGSSNVASGPTTTFITTTGFLLQWPTTTNGASFWLGTYTTVGNCLLAVDADARTFDHHCDACGHVSTAVPVSAVSHVTDLQPAMSFACPHCGAVEAFNTMLSAADEADSTPQGSGEYQTTRGAQATLIRALMRALDIEVAP